MGNNWSQYPFQSQKYQEMEREREIVHLTLCTPGGGTSRIATPLSLSLTQLFFSFCYRKQNSFFRFLSLFFWCVRVKVRFFKLVRDHLSLSWLIAHCELWGHRSPVQNDALQIGRPWRWWCRKGRLPRRYVSVETGLLTNFHLHGYRLH